MAEPAGTSCTPITFAFQVMTGCSSSSRREIYGSRAGGGFERQVVAVESEAGADHGARADAAGEPLQPLGKLFRPFDEIDAGGISGADPGGQDSGGGGLGEGELELATLRVAGAGDLGGGEVGHHSVEPQRLCRLNGGDEMAQLAAGTDALAGHSAIDLEMHRHRGAQGEALGGGLEPRDLLDAPDDRRELVPDDGRGVLLGDSAHDEDARLHLQAEAGGGQGLADEASFFNSGDSEPLGSGVREDLRAALHAVAVGVGLDHSQH